MATIMNTIPEGWVRASRYAQQHDDFNGSVRRSDEEIRELDWLYDLNTPESGSGFTVNKCWSGNRTFLKELQPGEPDTMLRVIGRLIDCNSPVTISVGFTNSEGGLTTLDSYDISAEAGFDMHNANVLQLLAEVNVGKYMRADYQTTISTVSGDPLMNSDIYIYSSDTNMLIDAIDMIDITPRDEDGEDEGELSDAGSNLIIREMLADVYNNQTLLKTMLSDLSKTVSAVNMASNVTTTSIARLQDSVAGIVNSLSSINATVSASGTKCDLIVDMSKDMHKASVDISGINGNLLEIDSKIMSVSSSIQRLNDGTGANDADSDITISGSTYNLRPITCCVITCVVVLLSSFIGYRRINK